MNLDLRKRIVIALVALAAGACIALTTATTIWAADQREQQLVDQAMSIAQVDASAVEAAIELRPEARSVSELDVDRTVSVHYAADAVLIPQPSPNQPAELSLAFQYVYANSEQPLTELVPQCLAITQPAGLVASPWQRGSSLGWNGRCGDYLFGYTLSFVGEGGGMHAWLTAVAIPEDTQYYLGLPSNLYITLALFSAVIVGVALVVALKLADHITKPLSRTRVMAEVVAAGDLSVRVPVRGHDEVARLSSAVNAMADRLTGQIDELAAANESQRRFVSDVAHELRTPTAALVASAAALEDPETRDAAAALVGPQLRRLATLTEDLLEISRMDAGRSEVVPSRIDLPDLLAEVIADTGFGIELIGPAHLELSVDAARLRVIVRNLLANALQHGAPPVVVRLAAEGAGVTVCVRDSGAGVSAELRDRVFDRFVRGEASRHGSSAGLGLAIAAENARLLGGSLELSDAGQEFTLYLPLDLHVT